MSEYHYLEKDELILEGDEVECSPDSWRDEPDWRPTKLAGQRAPDPQYIAHRKYRRKMSEQADAGHKINSLIEELVGHEKHIAEQQARITELERAIVEARIILNDIDETKYPDEEN